MPPCHFPTGLSEKKVKMEVNQKQMKTPLELRQHLCPEYYMFALNPAHPGLLINKIVSFLCTHYSTESTVRIFYACTRIGC